MRTNKNISKSKFQNFIANNGVPAVYISSKIMKDGRVISEHREKGNCWTANFMRQLGACFIPREHSGNGDFEGCNVFWNRTRYTDDRIIMAPTGRYSQGGNSSDYYENLFNLTQCGRSDVRPDKYGVLVGTGNTPTQLGDIWLESRIVNGTLGGELEYGGLVNNNPIQDKSTSYNWAVQRSFINNSGADIDVNEIGVATTKYNYAWYDYSIWNDDYVVSTLITRDIFSSPQTVPAGGNAVFTYEFVIEKGSKWEVTRNFLEEITTAALDYDNDWVFDFNAERRSASPNTYGIMFSTEDAEIEGNPDDVTSQLGHSTDIWSSRTYSPDVHAIHRDYQANSPFGDYKERISYGNTIHTGLGLFKCRLDSASNKIIFDQTWTDAVKWGIEVGDTINIHNSANGNDGAYTVSSINADEDGSGNGSVTLTEAIPADETSVDYGVTVSGIEYIEVALRTMVENISPSAITIRQLHLGKGGRGYICKRLDGVSGDPNEPLTLQPGESAKIRMGLRYEG